MKALIVDPLKCTGCRACEVACSFAHDGVFNPAYSRVKVSNFLEDLVFVPSVCLQCDEPYCAEVCPTEALEKDPDTGLVKHDQNKCIGCKQCIVACPWGAIKVHVGNKKIIKCDHCNGDPACVKVCPPKAIAYEELEDVVLSKQKATATLYKEMVKEMVRGVSP